jgi:hypothetical protein
MMLLLGHFLIPSALHLRCTGALLTDDIYVGKEWKCDLLTRGEAKCRNPIQLFNGNPLAPRESRMWRR